MASKKQGKALPNAPTKKVTPPIIVKPEDSGIELPSRHDNTKKGEVAKDDDVDNNGDGDDENSSTDLPFYEIVLVDMIASVRADKLVVVKKNMYDTDYACISYRWGEVTEQICLTPDYNAHITSFNLDDLLVVCQQILNWSSDGGNLDYEDDDGDDDGEGGDYDDEDDDATADGDDDDDVAADGDDVDDTAADGYDDDDALEEEAEPQDPLTQEDDYDDDPVHIYSEYAIPYLWVDAISVDQMDAVHKKATIHRMTDIYNNCQVIIAVPDLHRAHLERNPANYHCLNTISKYGRRIFRHVAQRCWRTEEEEEAYLESLNNEEQQQEEEDYDNDDDPNQEEDAVTVVGEANGHDHQQKRKHRGFRQFIKESIYYKTSEDKVEMVDNLSVKEGATATEEQEQEQEQKQKQEQEQEKQEQEQEKQEQEQEKQEQEQEGKQEQEGQEQEEQDTNGNNEIAAEEEEEQEGESQDTAEENEEEEEEEGGCTCTDDMDEEWEKDAYFKALEFVDYLIEDWSARVWVISEYSIGRLRKMKLWFISIHYFNYALRPRELLNMFDENEPTIYDSSLQERPFLHMMLNSKATRSEDRFYAVLPLYARYKHLAADGAISNWGISDDVSVRLQLYTMVSFEEKLTMFLCGVQPALQSNVVLPSFATTYKDREFDWAMELSNAKPTLIKSMDLVTTTTTDLGKKQYYLAVTVPWSRTFTDRTGRHDLSVASHALKKLGLGDLLDELVTVSIPITVHDQATQHTLNVKLFGHPGQNKWVVLHRMVDLVDVPPTPTTPTEEEKTAIPAHVRHHHHPPQRSASLDTLWTEKIEKDQVFHIY